jgi:hypothetical protein
VIGFFARNNSANLAHCERMCANLWGHRAHPLVFGMDARQNPNKVDMKLLAGYLKD